MKTSLLSDDIILISGQHVGSEDVTTSENGDDYLTGPTDFKGGKPFPTRRALKAGAYCEKGDALVVVKGSGTGAVFEADARYAIGRQLMAVRATSWQQGFLFHVLRANSARYQSQATGLIPGISRDHILNTRCSALQTNQQRKIADILTTWDEALTQLDALIEAQERRKKALMQQLLTRASSKAGTRHARQRMGCVLERVTRRNSALNDNVLTISAQGGLVSQKEYFNRSVAGADLSGYYLLHRGEFAYNRSYSKGYPYGALKRLDQFDSGVVSTLYLCFRIKEGAPVSPEYLVHYFEGGRLNSGLRCIAKEGARAHGLLNVTADEFFDLDIFLPSLPEQQKIAEILDTADQQLTLLRTQRTALDQQKRGLMQRLLTGNLRVKP